MMTSLGSSLQYRRIVVKAGTNVLTKRTDSLDTSVMAELVAQITEVRKLGAQVVLVSSGAIAAGREALGSRPDGRAIPEQQLLAAIGQSRLMHLYQVLFSHHEALIAQSLLTRHDLEDRQGYLNVRNTLEGLLDRGVVPVVNENDVVNPEEIGAGEGGFGDNDQLSALVANLIDADLLVLLTDTGGLYTADPKRKQAAQLIPQVAQVDDHVLALAEDRKDANSRGGMRSKLLAARLATASGVTVVIAGGGPDVIVGLAQGEQWGTLFPTTVSAMESRKRWLLSGLAPGSGAVFVDEGASFALRKGTNSLLPAGVLEVRGHFNRGDAIAILGIEGHPIAYGIANYGEADVRTILGVRSDEIIKRLGHYFGDEVVHRNNMAVLESATQAAG